MWVMLGLSLSLVSPETPADLEFYQDPKRGIWCPMAAGEEPRSQDGQTPFVFVKLWRKDHALRFINHSRTTETGDWVDSYDYEILKKDRAHMVRRLRNFSYEYLLTRGYDWHSGRVKLREGKAETFPGPKAVNPASLDIYPAMSVLGSGDLQLFVKFAGDARAVDAAKKACTPKVPTSGPNPVPGQVPSQPQTGGHAKTDVKSQLGSVHGRG